MTIMFSPDEFSSAQKKPRKSFVFKHYTRKFPGPAGLSPDYPPGEIEKLVSEETGLKGISHNGILLGSKYSDILLSKPSYRRLIEDYALNEVNNPLSHLTLQVVSKAFIRKAKRDMKVPFLGLLVSSISLEHGILWKLMDPTHEVNAVVNQHVWDEISEDVQVNSAITLMQVPVIASYTVRPPITLFVSKNNILSVYTETKNHQIEVKTFNQLPEADLKKTCSEWLSQMGLNPFGKTFPVRSSEVKSSLDHRSSDRTCSSRDDGPGDKVKSKWTTLKDDFLTDLDLTIHCYGETTSKEKGNGFPEESSGFTSSKYENFAPKRPKIDFGKSKNELSSTPLSTANSSNSAEECNFDMIGESEASSLATLKCFSPEKKENESEKLSQSEKLMVQEVLSGISFDDFDS